MHTPFAAGSGQTVQILSMTDRNPEIWKDSAQTRVGLKANKIGYDATRRTYFWDLYTFSDSYFPNTTTITGVQGEYGQLAITDTSWNALWVDSFTDHSGDNVYYRLPTPFAFNVFTQPKSEEFMYRGSLTCSPLIALFSAAPTPDPTIAIKTLYNLALVPGVPFFVTTSVAKNYSFGPNFVSSMKFTVEGSNGTLSPVTISLEWTGGKTILCDTATILTPGSVQPPTPNDSNIQPPLAYNHFRTAALMDCLVDTKATSAQLTDVTKSLINTIISESGDPTARMIGMELSIKQSVEFTTTMPTPAKIGAVRTSEQGLRFVTISNRVVSGTITLFSTAKDIPNKVGTQLTMYFGGPFVFAMPKIDWQKPQMSLQAGNGYIHTLSFLARADDSAVSMYTPTSKTPCSEFILPTPKGSS